MIADPSSISIICVEVPLVMLWIRTLTIATDRHRDRCSHVQLCRIFLIKLLFTKMLSIKTLILSIIWILWCWKYDILARLCLLWSITNILSTKKNKTKFFLNSFRSLSFALNRSQFQTFQVFCVPGFNYFQRKKIDKITKRKIYKANEEWNSGVDYLKF